MAHIKITIILLACLLNIIPVFSQHHEHAHQENEIGISGGAVYCPDHKEWGTGIHLHYFRLLDPHSKWSLGGGIEGVWTDNPHFSVNIGAKYEVIDRLSIGLMPGIMFSKHKKHEDSENYQGDSDYEANFSLHVETVYDLFHWEKFHLGPAIDYSWAKDDSHFFFGIHAAYCF